MANEEYLARLKKGVEAWNAWRAANRDIMMPNLIGAYLPGAQLSGVQLSGAQLSGAHLSGAHLSGADLSGADLSGADLVGAQLSGAQLSRADLARADLAGADLAGADLAGAQLSGVNLFNADLHKTIMRWTILGNIDLSKVQGLETVQHQRPSTIGIDTLYRSQGNIPDIFLRGAGVPEEIITYSRSLVGQPFQYYSCFISYSSQDEALAKRLHVDLQDKGVRCWFAPEDIKIGDEFRSRIDESIQVYDRLLLILSEDSVASPWVQKEVEMAFEKEGKENRIVLFPIRIDEAIMHVTVGWAADIRRQRHIGDFRQWKNHDAYQKVFQQLLRDLRSGI
jgi:hypothetical protein